MRKHHPENERIKRRYFRYLKEAKRLSEHSLDGIAKAIHASFRVPSLAVSRNFRYTRRMCRAPTESLVSTGSMRQCR